VNRWSRIVWTLSLLAAIGWIAGGWFGYEVRDGASLARHTLLVFFALLALVLTHGWVAIYLLAVEQLLRRRARPSQSEESSLARARRRGAIGAALAIAAALAQFAVSNALFPDRLDAGWHAWGALGTAMLLALAALLERSALAATGELARALAD